MEEIETTRGTIQLIYQITLGEIAIVTLLSLVLILMTLKWLIQTLWNGGR